METKSYWVEGHGLGTLIVLNGAFCYNPRRPAPNLTREAAWEAVKELKARTDLHTIKVVKDGIPVWKCNLIGGNWSAWVGGKAVAA